MKNNNAPRERLGKGDWLRDLSWVEAGHLGVGEPCLWALQIVREFVQTRALSVRVTVAPRSVERLLAKKAWSCGFLQSMPRCAARGSAYVQRAYAKRRLIDVADEDLPLALGLLSTEPGRIPSSILSIQCIGPTACA